MAISSVKKALQTEGTMVSDGAWGTLLASKGLGADECPEQWCLTNEKAVAEVAASYVSAGPDMIKTNSFGGNALKLRLYGLEEKVGEINRKAAQISREEMGPNGWVLAPVGPTGKMLMTGEITQDELYETFSEQCVALAEGGTDVILVETMIDVEEAKMAVKAAKENTDCEIAATFTFDETGKGEYRTMMGNLPGDAARQVQEVGADIVGANCGCGFERMVHITSQIRETLGDVPVLVHANAGMPKLVDGESVYPETPDEVAGHVPALIQAGVSIIGGCCGTTPDHIRALRKAVDAQTQG